jgi:hypothetical protein
MLALLIIGGLLKQYGRLKHRTAERKCAIRQSLGKQRQNPPPLSLTEGCLKVSEVFYVYCAPRRSHLPEEYRDDLAVMAVEGKGNAHHLAVPAGELQPIRAPAYIWRSVATWSS